MWNISIYHINRATWKKLFRNMLMSVYISLIIWLFSWRMTLFIKHMSIFFKPLLFLASVFTWKNSDNLIMLITDCLLIAILEITRAMTLPNPVVFLKLCGLSYFSKWPGSPCKHEVSNFHLFFLFLQACNLLPVEKYLFALPCKYHLYSANYAKNKFKKT